MAKSDWSLSNSACAVGEGRDVRAGKALQKQLYVGLIDVAVPVQPGPLARQVVLRHVAAAGLLR